MDFEKEIDNLISIALEEDIGRGDITAQACIPEDAVTAADLVLKESGTIAALPFFRRVFEKIDRSIEIEFFVKEGCYYTTGTTLGRIKGRARAILSGERTALNLLQHASGVASITANYVRKLRSYDCLILDTRATLPGLRSLEKYAVKTAGGVIHRYGLEDRVIIKKNYLAFFAGTATPITLAVQRVKTTWPNIPIEVEVSSMEELEEALLTPIDAVMLENMNPEQTRRCVKAIHRKKLRAFVQNSAAITLETVREYAATGVDGISIGALTHSVRDLHITLRLVGNPRQER